MNNNNDFLPASYEAPKSNNNYMKLQQGENRFRILSKPILGWLDWKDKKPLRFQMNEKPAKPIDPTKPIKHFWAMVVWNAAEATIQILEITQSTIQTAIQHLSNDEDWGAPFGYDIKITKVGEKLDTEYAVSPVPHKPVSDEIKKALSDKGKINLEALFEGGDPFEGEAKEVAFEKPSSKKIPPNKESENHSTKEKSGAKVPNDLPWD